MIDLAAVTPQAAFEMYRGNIEEYEQAAPIIILDFGFPRGLEVKLIQGESVQAALWAMSRQGWRVKAALLSAEARATVVAPDGTVGEPSDMVAISYMDFRGHAWTAVRRFKREGGEVTYLEDLHLPEGGQGGIHDALSALVGVITTTEEAKE